MLETSARLLRLLSLFQGRKLWPGAELATRLDVTSRTLRRDVDKLRTLGYPIHSACGAEGGYRFGAGANMPPLLFDDEEAIAVALGLGCATAGAMDGMQEAAVGALAKIEQMLPPRLARRVSALQSMIVTPTGTRPSVAATTLTTIAAACRDNLCLEFRYLDAAGNASARRVDPLRLVHTARRWYLVAWDQARQDWRTFRADRIQSRPMTGESFTARTPPARDLVAYVTRGITFAPPLRARVKLLCPASAVARRTPCSRGTIEPIDDSTCRFEIGESSWEYAAMHVLFLGVDFEVIGPPEFAAELRRIAKRLRRACDHSE